MKSYPAPAWLGLLLLAGAGCSGGVDESAPRATLETAADGTTLIAVESDTLIDGRRPKLVLVCKAGSPPGLQLDFVRAPATPPPAREVFAQVQAKGGVEVTIELSRIEGARWQAPSPDPRQPESDSDDRENQRRLVPILYAFSRERLLYLTPPAAYAPGERLVWNPRTLGEHLAAAQVCAFTERPTI